MQALKDHEEKMAAKVAYWETEVLPQRGLAVPAFAAPRLQQVYMSATAPCSIFIELLLSALLFSAQ